MKTTIRNTTKRHNPTLGKTIAAFGLAAAFSIGGNCNAQVITGSNLDLTEPGGASIRMVPTVGTGFEIEALGSDFEIGVDGANGGIFKILENAKLDALTLTPNGIVIGAENSTEQLSVVGDNARSSLELVPALGSNSNARLVAENGPNTLSLEARGSSTSFQQFFRSSLDAPEDALTIQPGGLVSVGIPFSTPDPFNSTIAKLRVPGTIIFDEAFPGDTPWLAGGAIGFFTISDIDSQDTPFSIRAGAPHDSFFVNTDGNVGLGIGLATEASLHLLRDDGTAQILVEEASATPRNRSLMELRNNGGVRFTLDNSDASEIWEFTNNTNGNFIINRVGSTRPDGTRGPEFQVTRNGNILAGPAGFRAFNCQPNGNLFIAGSLTEMSDRNSKENYEDINCEEILAKVAELPLTTWNYKSDDEDVRHIGPVAQDFREAFELGHNATTISTSDKIGVNMAAIKALKNAVDQKDLLIESQRLELEAQKATLDALQERMDAMEAALLSQ